LLDFDQAVTLNPNNDDARAARGLALLMKGNAAEGLPNIDRALERNPNNLMALLGRGVAMLTTGQFDRAVLAFNQVIPRLADDHSARVLRARAYIGKNDTADAMTDLNYVLTFMPGNAEALTLRGEVRSSLRDYGPALTDLNLALDKQETVEGYFARGKIYEVQGDVPRATSDFRRSTELKPKGVFDLLAQAEAKKRIQQMTKRVPCGNAGPANNDGACL
jgi:tetratricopeptide (TPR) repeat protein